MNILVTGATGFIGTNLTLSLSEIASDRITAVDVDKSFFCKAKNILIANY